MRVINALKSFFSSKFNIILVAAVLILGIMAFFFTSTQPVVPVDSEEVSIHFFYMPTCPHCTEQKPVYEEVKQLRPEIDYYEHDASTQQGYALFFKMADDAGLDTTRLGVPTIFVGKHALVGFQPKENILSAIDECIEFCKGEEYLTDKKDDVASGFSEFELPFIGRVDLTQWSLPVLAVVLGLVDGFNPCALWVLIFLITLLLGEKSKKKIWLVLGSFVFASAVSYFLFMTAWLNLFIMIGYVRILTLIIGMFALGAGFLHLKEYFTTKGDLTCKVGDEKSKKKTMDKIQSILAQPLTLGVIISIIGLAFVVNAIEFVCSAAIPAIFTQLLVLSGISTFHQYMYILLYLFFYMLDHIIIFGAAGLALGSGLIQKYAKQCKLIGGVVLVILGFIMLFAPQLLR